MSGTWSGSRSQEEATSVVEAVGSELVAIANQTFPGKTATRSAALAGPAHLARRRSAAASTNSAIPEIAIIGPGAGRNGGISAAYVDGRTRWTTPDTTKSAASAWGAKRRTVGIPGTVGGSATGCCNGVVVQVRTEMTRRHDDPGYAWSLTGR